MSTSEIIEAALALPAESKTELVKRLLASLDEEHQKEIDAAWAGEIEDRIAALDRGEMEEFPAEQVLAELRGLSQ